MKCYLLRGHLISLTRSRRIHELYACFDRNCSDQKTKEGCFESYPISAIVVGYYCTFAMIELLQTGSAFDGACLR